MSSPPPVIPATLTAESLAELRHDLRTPVNHIIGYAEMLAEDATGPALASRLSHLEEILAAAREILTLINSMLGLNHATFRAGDVVMLYEALRHPRQRIVSAVTAVLGAPDGQQNASLADDLGRILAAAGRLAGPAETTPPGGTAANGAAAGQHAAGAGAAGDAGAGAAGDNTAGPRQARILVVDDVEDNREVLRRRLTREGHAVETAENGRRALELVRQKRFDLVLLDVKMPELDGYAVLETMKGSAVLRDIPVVMISALDELAGIVRCIERGAEDFLHKPFDPVLLRARINASLDKKRLRDQEMEYLERVNQLIEAATAVEAGTYQHATLAPLARRVDELGRLARVFDSMVVQMKAREERLRDQVSDLRQEIGFARRDVREMSATVDGGNLRSGERFAHRYEVVSVLGRGGMGTVYRARDLELDEEVAIKTLRPELLADATLLARFKDEIRLARRLSDQNIVRTHDFGEWAGVYFLTMEYVEGITVRELLDTRGRLGTSSTLAIATQLAHSLFVAHEHGVIHRDIKPQNLLLDDAGVLKVMDFGVARLAERTSTLTETGMVVGTPTYMPPEQLLAEHVDARSDLYAAGVVLYECLTGAPPFEAGSVTSLVARVLTQEPRPPMSVNAEIPPALSALIMRLLAKKPEERVQSASALAEQLAELG